MSDPSPNHWLHSECAQAFWNQHELPPYRRLLAETTAWLHPCAGERWLDLGCGCGQLTQVLWQQSQGSVREIVGLDCAAVNSEPYRKLGATLRPIPNGRIRFVVGDFSSGLPGWADHYFDGVVSGLAIPYAESFDPASGQWTRAAYDHLLTEIARVLRPGGRFVFSVNVPDPCWFWVAVYSMSGLWCGNPARFFKRAWRIWSYGSWLKQESFHGRFHYLPAATICDKLRDAGFADIEHRDAFVKQAYLFRCRRR
jgi:ubiquinone/menaquinone biosynthesis C-methylase UbiE